MSNKMVALKAGRPSLHTKAKSLQEVSGETETTRVNFDLDKKIYKSLKIYAVEKDLSVAEILRELIIKALDN